MRAADCLVDSAFAPQLNVFRASLGSIKPVKRVFDDWFLCQSGVFVMYPEHFERAVDRYSRKVFQIDFPQDSGGVDETTASAIRTAKEFIDRDTAPTVVFVSASGNPPFASRFFANAVKAMRKLKKSKAILLTRHRDRIGELPENTIHIEFLPLHLCRDAGLKIAVLVHHGTIGCSATALRSAWPQVVIPAAFDQPYNAAILEALHVAQVIPMSRLTCTRLVKALEIALEDDTCVVEYASRFRASDAPSPQACVAEIIAKELLQYS
jgi:UDP:flavonoid glycosyltransferase YjiC (YdhE family)